MAIAHALEGAGLPDVDGTGPEGEEYVRAAEQRGSQGPGCSAAGLVHDLPSPRGFVYGGASGDRRVNLAPDPRPAERFGMYTGLSSFGSLANPNTRSGLARLLLP